MANSVDVARELLKLANKDGKSLTNMQLQKLVYIAHGLHLAYHDKPLLDEEVSAWKHGPVIPKVYYAFKQYLNTAIDTQTEGSPQLGFSSDEIDSIRGAYDNFAKFNGWTLRNITHKEGSPWWKVWYDRKGRETFNAIIPNSVIKEHYLTIKETGKATIL
ncbi:Panacea domain-containing protein [Pleionea mediterranea]|uniref:Putative phage-associated protein n=1 Tax=Pleionea mediterranea TaxID=523701 RepID=A0A316FWB9_9GAMM|nr:type II toxin-antitoxin system antitoxin SocA domain-containing protein [Pleionea mediterranea]PWK52859.1 putative phage-associated protein [Pleionea mediterranea]